MGGRERSALVIAALALTGCKADERRVPPIPTVSEPPAQTYAPETAPEISGEKSNQILIEKLKSELGITSETTRLDLARLAYQKNATNWKTETTIGAFTNPLGRQLTFETNAGGEVVWGNVDRNLEYPRITDRGYYSMYDFDGDIVLVYGTRETAERFLVVFRNQELLWRKFLREYFGDSHAYARALHLDYSNIDTPPPYLDVLGNGQNPELTPYSGGGTSMLSDDTDGSLLRHDSIVRFHALDLLALETGLSRDFFIRYVLAENEISMLEDQYALETNGVPHTYTRENVSVSSLTGILAGLDSGVTESLLGGETYREIIELFVAEMERLGEVQGRESY